MNVRPDVTGDAQALLGDNPETTTMWRWFRKMGPELASLLALLTAVYGITSFLVVLLHDRNNELEDRSWAIPGGKLFSKNTSMFLTWGP